MNAETFSLGDRVTVGKSTSVYRVVALAERRDAAGQPYVMASLSNDNGTVGRQEETTRLKRAKQ